MKFVVMTLVLLVGPAAAWANAGAEPATSDDARECMINFVEEGSFFKGKTYKTWQEYKAAEYDRVFRMVAQAVAENKLGYRGRQ